MQSTESAEPTKPSALRALASAFGQAYRLTKPYFRSHERGAAWGLLLAIVALNLLLVYFNVLYTYWYKIAYDALQSKTAANFWASMFTYRVVHGFPYFVPGFTEIVTVLILVSVYAFYLNQMLQIRWRRWLTASFVGDWLAQRAYYRLSLRGGAGTAIDNPDQRIADDVQLFVSATLTLGISLLSNVVTLFSFIGVLWFIAPPLLIGHVAVPGYLVWAALGYSIVGSYFTQRIGSKLIPLNVQQQQVDADFRFGLMRVRENSEPIALFRGEADEAATLQTRFAAIYDNWWKVMKRTKALNFFSITFSQIALIFPLVVAAPNYFAGVFSLGVLLQIATIFGNVQGALSWFVTSYADLVAWRATVQRLADFAAALRAAHAAADAPEIAVTAAGHELRADALVIALPDGRPLIAQPRLTIAAGAPLAISGPSGVGKSTIFRTLAGLWPYGSGAITVPADAMFLPQHAYLPIGTLKRAVVYPRTESDVPDRIAVAALERVGLPHLATQLGAVRNWSLVLSGGEVQRLAFVRALIVRPPWLFLDEATSALDEDAAAELFGLLRSDLPQTQIVSIAHIAAAVQLHERHAQVIAARDGGPARIEVAGEAIAR